MSSTAQDTTTVSACGSMETRARVHAKRLGSTETAQLLAPAAHAPVDVAECESR
eukprot:COSAG06_NODE_735_length_12697_cov_9.204398_1_plen_53_part_10